MARRRLLPGADARQGLVALALNSSTSLVAGAMLGSLTATFERRPGLLVLVPAAIGLRGNVFGSLGILAGYRDWRVMLTATLVVAGDHLVRGLVWPESVYGIVNPEWWRFLEHAFWVVFAVSFLVVLCLRSLKEMRLIAERGAELEALSESEWRKSSVIERAKLEAVS